MNNSMVNHSHAPYARISGVFVTLYHSKMVEESFVYVFAVVCSCTCLLLSENEVYCFLCVKIPVQLDYPFRKDGRYKSTAV